MRYLFAFLLLLPSAVFGQNFTASLEVDLNGDGIKDRAELKETSQGGGADLYIWLGKSDGTMHLGSKANELVWVGGIGQQPEIGLTQHGSLQIVSQNIAIGRDRWVQTLTIAWRGGAFVLAGFTYNWYDTLNLESSGSCDVNLLNGRGELFKGKDDRKTTFRTKLRAMPIEKWDKNIPKECGL